MSNVFNPHNKPEADLPTIFGFVNGHGMGGVIAVLLAEDGEGLGSHASSNEGWAKFDLGVEGNTRSDRHKTFQSHYPDGYKMEWLDKPSDDPRFLKAVELNGQKQKENGREEPIAVA